MKSGAQRTAALRHEPSAARHIPDAAHHLPHPKTSDTIQHDVESCEKYLEIQGLIVQ
jgi:hypothetical protein